MGFFDLPERDPEEEDLELEDEQDELEGSRPAAWIGGVVPVELLVARSEEAAVTAGRILAYPDGFELTVNSYLHRSVTGRRRRNRHHPFMWQHMAEPGEPLPEDLLRIGLAWPDGGRATNVDAWGRSWPDATEPAHGLDEHGGGGSDWSYSHEFWAWPVPEAGPLRVVVEWPAFGIAETSTEIDGRLIADAAARARPVWPEDAGRASHFARVGVMGGTSRRATARVDEPPGP